MPLSELFKLASGKLESSQKSRGENDLVELVWQNGQIKMQSQSGRAATRSPVHDVNSVHDRKVGCATSTRIGKFAGVQSILDDISPVVPLEELDLSEDDEMVPWLRSYPGGDAMAQDYGSGFATGMSGVTANGKSTQNSFASVDKRSTRDDQVARKNSNLLNFSHFSRPAALVSSKLSTCEGMKRVEVNETCANNVVESGLIERCNNKPKNADFIASSTKPGMANSEKATNVCREVKNAEPVAASSSVCSGNGANRVPCEKIHYSKRKFCDIEDSECRSDDIETESTGVTKPAPARGGSGLKRSRAAEVHNLSERRRRDRINEKMRALQELIPNCSKVDKASMLDEAIEYLKTLQLQVQIMSMGAGLCMPPMMFPTGMQHIRPAAHVPHFSPMGFGMGYGMGLPDMNGRAPGCPIFPVPHMQAGRFPSPMFQGVPAPSLPVYTHLNQGLPNSVPRAPLVPVTEQPPVNSAMALSSFKNKHQDLGCGDLMKNKISDSILKAEASGSMNHESTPLQKTNKALDRASTAATNIINEAGCE